MNVIEIMFWLVSIFFFWIGIGIGIVGGIGID